MRVSKDVEAAILSSFNSALHSLMFLINVLITLLLSEAIGVDLTPLFLLVLGAAVVVPLMWWGGSKLWRSSNSIYKTEGWLLRFFAILIAVYALWLLALLLFS